MLMKLESDLTPAMTKVAVVSTTSRSLEPVAVDLGFRKVRNQIVAGIARRAATSAVMKSAELLEGGDVLRGAPFRRLIGRDRKNDLAPNLPWSRSGSPMGRNRVDRDLAGKIGDEVEMACSSVRSSARSAISQRRSITGRACVWKRRLASSARSRSWRGGSVVPSVPPARPGSSSIRLPAAEEKSASLRRVDDIVEARQNPEAVPSLQ